MFEFHRFYTLGDQDLPDRFVVFIWPLAMVGLSYDIVVFAWNPKRAGMVMTRLVFPMTQEHSAIPGMGFGRRGLVAGGLKAAVARACVSSHIQEGKVPGPGTVVGSDAARREIEEFFRDLPDTPIIQPSKESFKDLRKAWGDVFREMVSP